MSVFISYSHRDADFVERLSYELIRRNIKVWRDEWKLGPGVHFPDRLNEAIAAAPYFCVVVSEHTVESEWVGRELAAALERTESDPSFVIVPLRVDETAAPPSLSSRVEIDFREDFDSALARLVALVSEHYNLTDAGAVDDGSPYFFFHAIEEGDLDGRFYMRLDTVSFDLEERECVIGELLVLGREAATLEHFELGDDDSVVDLVLRACAEEFRAEPGRIKLTRRKAEAASFDIVDGEGAGFDANLRLRWMATQTSRSSIYDYGSVLIQVCRAEGIDSFAT